MPAARLSVTRESSELVLGGVVLLGGGLLLSEQVELDALVVVVLRDVLVAALGGDAVDDSGGGEGQLLLDLVLVIVDVLLDFLGAADSAVLVEFLLFSVDGIDADAVPILFVLEQFVVLIEVVHVVRGHHLPELVGNDQGHEARNLGGVPVNLVPGATLVVQRVVGEPDEPVARRDGADHVGDLLPGESLGLVEDPVVVVPVSFRVVGGVQGELVDVVLPLLHVGVVGPLGVEGETEGGAEPEEGVRLHLVGVLEAGLSHADVINLVVTHWVNRNYYNKL